MTATETALLNEAAWHGKAFTGAWAATAGGTVDVIEKAIGKCRQWLTIMDKASTYPF